MMQQINDVIYGQNIIKKYKGFTLDIPELHIPAGFATALVGENGAGKTTLLNALAGVRLDFDGDITYFGTEKMAGEAVKERIGYTSPGDYYMRSWTVQQARELYALLFDGFDPVRYDELLSELNIVAGELSEKGRSGKVKSKKIEKLSDGNRTKLMLAGVLARRTDLLILDEPASPLDPLMRDRLCDIIRGYIDEGAGSRSVFFSTHNISDMESVTDYCILMEDGQIVEQGFVPDLKEKYIMVQGDEDDYAKASPYLISTNRSSFGFEGLALASDTDRFVGMNIARPDLSAICVGIMKSYSKLAGKEAPV